MAASGNKKVVWHVKENLITLSPSQLSLYPTTHSLFSA